MPYSQEQSCSRCPNEFWAQGLRCTGHWRHTYLCFTETVMRPQSWRSMFERAGFEVVGTTDAVASKMPRIVMRRTLT